MSVTTPSHSDEASAFPIEPRPVPFAADTEVRLAVVMYGGVSLAIYMNGIAQEILNLVRSTAPSRPMSQGPTEALYADGELSGTAAVYREVARRMRPAEGDPTLRVRFVVDIVSGTSAGGLNGLFLGKALACEQSISSLRDLWVSEGEIGSLLNDARSYEGLGDLRKREPSRSLLNSARMYARLLQAFAGMADHPLHPTSGTFEESRLVEELDVYVTATDLTGMLLPIYLPRSRAAQPAPPTDAESTNRRAPAGYERVEERLHRANFHLQYAAPHIRRTVSVRGDAEAAGEARSLGGTSVRIDDFRRANDPFLAFVGRCTSAIVPAFEPMRLADLRPVLESTANPDPEGYVYEPERWRHLYRDFWRQAPIYGRSVQEALAEFPYRPFGDGGYLDNRPFTYATATLARRRADRAIRRKLLYVEPNPERPDAAKAPPLDAASEKPDFFEHLTLAASLPGKESIREDIERLRERNDVLGRVDDAIRLIRAGGGLADADPAGFPAYLAVRAEDAAEHLSETLRGLLGIEEESPSARALLYLVREWRDQMYPGEGPRRYLPFLERFDWAYALRRHEFLQHSLETRIEERPENPQRFRQAKIALNERFSQRIVETPRLTDVRKELVGHATAGAPLTTELARNVAALQVSLAELGYILSGPEEESAGEPSLTRARRARIVLGYEPHPEAATPERIAARPALLERIHDAVAERFALSELRDDLVRELEEEPRLAPVRDVLRDCLQEFPAYDIVSFPLLFGTAAAETARVDVLRVSPLEATTLVDDPAERPRKLAGVGLGHFAAFFDADWRRMDIIWGRLDGAERLICSLLPESRERRRLIAEAQVAVLVDSTEWLAGQDGARVDLNSLLKRVLDRAQQAGIDQDELLLEMVRRGALTLDQKAEVLKRTGNATDALPVRRELPPRAKVRLARRSASVFGQMSDRLWRSRRGARGGGRVVGYVAYLLRAGAQGVGVALVAASHVAFLAAIAALGLALALFGGRLHPMLTWGGAFVAATAIAMLVLGVRLRRRIERL